MVSAAHRGSAPTAADGVRRGGRAGKALYAVGGRDGTGASRPAGDRVDSVAGEGVQRQVLGRDGAIRGRKIGRWGGIGGVLVVVIIDGGPLRRRLPETLALSNILKNTRQPRGISNVHLPPVLSTQHSTFSSTPDIKDLTN